MGWYTSNTTISFGLGRNQVIDTLLEDPHLLHILDKSEVELIGDKFQTIETTTAAWLEASILE